jgi:single-strand DNA-binding protein
MRSINKVILIGNLTRDPEMKQIAGGQNIVTFGLATNREWITKDGRRNSMTEFHDLVAWANLADICSKYLKKGKLIYVEGYLKTRNWDLPDGTRKFRTEIVVQDMIMLDRKSGEDAPDYIPECTGETATTPAAHEAHESHTTHGESPTDNAPSERESETRNAPRTPHRAPVNEHREPRKEPVIPKTQAETPKPADINIDTDLGL